MSARLLTPVGSVVVPVEFFAMVDSVAVIVCNESATTVVDVVLAISVAVAGVSVVGGGNLEVIRVVVFSDVVDVVSIDVVVCAVAEVVVAVVEDVVISAVALLFHS
jgi:hypothetical protein